jgi:hypothetical protein
MCGANGSPTLTFSNCGGFTLDNLIINNGAVSGSASAGIFVNITDGNVHSHGITIANCAISDAQYGIDFSVGTNLVGQVNSIAITNNTIYNCGACGILISSSGTAATNYSNVSIQGNTIHAVAGINDSAVSGVGIQLQNCGS